MSAYISEINEHDIETGAFTWPRSRPSGVAWCEYVSPDHCDKICDRIGDSIVDHLSSEAVGCRTSIEVVGSGQLLFITGEIYAPNLTDDFIAKVVEDSARWVLDRVGIEGITIDCRLRQQDAELTAASASGSGNQALCIGYADAETTDLLPPEYSVARKLTHRIYEAARGDPHIGTDGKVLLLGGERGWEAWIRWHTAIDAVEAGELITGVAQDVGIKKVHVNPDAPFRQSQFSVDTGVLGRKIVVDQYGPRVPIGGGAISGKDPTKVDRSGNYAARHVACEIVRELGGQALIWITYTLGRSVPLDARFLQFGMDGTTRCGQLCHSLLSVDAIIERFGLTRPQGGLFYDLATFGHYGRGLPWD